MIRSVVYTAFSVSIFSYVLNYQSFGWDFKTCSRKWLLFQMSVDLYINHINAGSLAGNAAVQTNKQTKKQILNFNFKCISIEVTVRREPQDPLLLTEYVRLQPLAIFF